jgi:hypothetical protein
VLYPLSYEGIRVLHCNASRSAQLNAQRILAHAARIAAQWCRRLETTTLMQISHFSSGALVGGLSPNPPVAFIAGVAAHFVIDKIPHYWPESTRGKWLFTIADYAIAISLFAAIFATRGAGITNMVWGLLGSAAVDVLLVGVPFLRKSRLGQWHTNRQPHRAERWMLMSDALLSAACLSALALL